MKGVCFVIDSKKRLKAVQIDIKTIEKHQEELEDFLDGLIASLRKGEPNRDLDKVKKSLRKKGKL